MSSEETNSRRGLPDQAPSPEPSPMPSHPLPEGPPRAGMGPAGTVHRLDPGAVQLWWAQGALRLFLLNLPGLGILAVLLAGSLGVPPALLLFVGGVTFSALQVLLWPPLAWKRFRYALREDDLWISRGVIFRQETVIPLNRIQHVDTRQGPLERLLGLSRVVIFTASGMAPDGGIPGLDSDSANALRDLLALRGGDDGL